MIPRKHSIKRRRKQVIIAREPEPERYSRSYTYAHSPPMRPEMPYDKFLRELKEK